MKINIPIFVCSYLLQLSICLWVQGEQLSDGPVSIVRPLWKDGAPGGGDPTITIHFPPPDAANGSVAVVCPGGSYAGLASYEGDPVAKWLNSLGVAGAVLTYRHQGTGFGHPFPLQDIQRAIRILRFQAERRKWDPMRIGAVGFSAGGHLCSTAGTHFDRGDPKADDVIDRESCRPDFLILIYASITLDEKFAHPRTKRNLLGEDPDPDLVEYLSNDRHVTERTPPTFLVHALDDSKVPVEHSVLFYMALRTANVPAEMHLFERGGHGGGLKHNSWPELAIPWLRIHGLLPSP